MQDGDEAAAGGPRQGAQGERQRRREREQDRAEHAQEQGLGPVDGDPLVGGGQRGGQCGGEGEQAAGERERAPASPRPAPPPQPQHTGQVRRAGAGEGGPGARSERPVAPHGGQRTPAGLRRSSSTPSISTAAAMTFHARSYGSRPTW